MKFCAFFLKLLPMIVKLSSITFHSNLHWRIGIGTQNLNPSVSGSSSFLKMLPTLCKTRQHIRIEYFTKKIWIWYPWFTWKLFCYWKAAHLHVSLNCCRLRGQPGSIPLQNILYKNFGFGTQNLHGNTSCIENPRLFIFP